MISKDVSERWNILQQQKRESVLPHKGEIKILIYGAYNPPGDEEHLGEKERLIKLRDYLRNDGYTNTYIVEDFPSDEGSVSSNLDKSFDCLEFADLNILVFTFRGKTDSVARELTYSIQNHLLLKCKVFEEVHNGTPAMGTLLREELRAERYTIVEVEYENDTDLHEHVLGDVFSFLVNRFKTRYK